MTAWLWWDSQAIPRQRSVSVRVRSLSRAVTRDKRFELRLIFASKAVMKETTTQDSLWTVQKFYLQQQQSAESAQSQNHKFSRDRSTVGCPN
jgi:hypothetical protein